MDALRMPVAVELSLNRGVPFFGWGWPSSSRVTRMGQARWAARKRPPVSASAAEAMTFLIVLHMTCTGEFVMGVGVVVGSLPRIYHAAARERAFSSRRR